jgi:hypothetical protein
MNRVTIKADDPVLSRIREREPGDQKRCIPFLPDQGNPVTIKGGSDIPDQGNPVTIKGGSDIQDQGTESR